jgi:hypothetical protein
MVERIRAHGHEHVTCRHRTTLEITREGTITPRADCIAGVRADRALIDLGEDFREAARDPEARILVRLRVGEHEERILGRGHPGLSLSHPTDLIIRKSSFTCPRTLMVQADKGARDLDREFVSRLRDPEAVLTAEIRLL